MAAPLSINSFMKCVVKLQHKYIVIMIRKMDRTMVQQYSDISAP